MKVAFTNNFNIIANGSASTKNTKGEKLFDKLFGSWKSKEEPKVQSFNNDHAGANVEINGSIELSAEISVEEFSELSKLQKDNSLLQREELSWLYNGAKNFCSDLAKGIETRGKEVVNSIFDVTAEYNRREHEADVQKAQNRADLEIERFQAEQKVQKAKESKKD